jgi:WS/DGAT/MGAT family acyltransferase
MCAGALRAYLVERAALPDAPLVAMVPVSLRTKDEQDAGGNMVGTILCNLATDVVDPAQRRDAISTSMTDNKKVFAELPRTQALALSAFLMSGLAMGLLPGFVSSAPPPFNIVISNVPGASEPLYWNGARLDGNYPFSIALDGQALNITMTNNGDNLDFGLVWIHHGERMREARRVLVDRGDVEHVRLPRPSPVVGNRHKLPRVCRAAAADEHHESIAAAHEHGFAGVQIVDHRRFTP